MDYGSDIEKMVRLGDLPVVKSKIRKQDLKIEFMLLRLLRDTGKLQSEKLELLLNSPNNLYIKLTDTERIYYIDEREIVRIERD